MRIETYYFGICHYKLFVLADIEVEMFRTVKQHPRVKRDENAEIDSWEQIDLTYETNRVL